MPYSAYALANSSRFFRAFTKSCWLTVNEVCSLLERTLGFSSTPFLIISSATTSLRRTSTAWKLMVTGVADILNSILGLMLLSTFSLFIALRPPNMCSSSITTTMGTLL